MKSRKFLACSVYPIGASSSESLNNVTGSHPPPCPSLKEPRCRHCGSVGYLLKLSTYQLDGLEDYSDIVSPHWNFDCDERVLRNTIDDPWLVFPLNDRF